MGILTTSSASSAELRRPPGPIPLPPPRVEKNLKQELKVFSPRCTDIRYKSTDNVAEVPAENGTGDLGTWEQFALPENEGGGAWWWRMRPDGSEEFFLERDPGPWEKHTEASIGRNFWKNADTG